MSVIHVDMSGLQALGLVGVESMFLPLISLYNMPLIDLSNVFG